jgi:uncharacterized membrane protein
MTKVPLGIFWDIENCPNLNILRKKSNGIARALRNFIEDKHPECTFPLEFCCAWDTRNKEDISKRLSNNGIDVLYANATSKNAADEKLKEEIDKFIYQHGPNAMVVIITGDINFKRSIQIALQKGLQVILIYGESASQPLLNLVKESYSIDDILETVEDETCEELGQTGICLIRSILSNFNCVFLNVINIFILCPKSTFISNFDEINIRHSFRYLLISILLSKP